MKNNKIKAVIFDVGGVLQLELGSVHEFMAKKYNLNIDRWFDSIDAPYSYSIEGKINENKMIKEITENLKTSKKRFLNLFGKAYNLNFIRNNQLYRLVEKLKNQGYIVGILTNQWYVSKKYLLKKNDENKFHVSIVSCDVKERKPNLRIYKLLIKKINKKRKKIKTNEILFIDNLEVNLIPARKLGIKTILFKDNKKFFREFDGVMR